MIFFYLRFLECSVKVTRLFWEQKIVGSNPVIPISNKLGRVTGVKQGSWPVVMKVRFFPLPFTYIITKFFNKI